MKILATLSTVAVMLVPAVAAACPMHEQHATQISCTAGQVFDEATRSCVPQAS